MAVRLAPTLAIAIALLTAAAPAVAHKVVLSVYASGARIDGEVGFSNGDVAPGAVIEVFGPDGGRLHRLEADADGLFAFTATVRADHVVKADLGAGHVAEARIRADELPGSLAPDAAAAAVAPPLAGGLAAIGSGAAAEAVPGAVSTADLDAMIREAVASQVRPLRDQLNDYQNQVRWSDVLGGLGTILGLTGLLAWWQARRPRRAGAAPERGGDRRGTPVPGAVPER